MSSATYLRLLLPLAIPAQFDQVLYIDCDVLVTGDVSALFALDLVQQPIWAVADLQHEREFLRLRQSFPSLAFAPGATYFNAGVLLIYLPLWRDHAIAERAMQHLAQTPEQCRWLDQFALNLATLGGWGRLPDIWNMQIFGKRHSGTGSSRGPAEPGIFYFIGQHKPWLFRGRCLNEGLYLRALIRSGWYDTNRSLRFCIRHLASQLRSRLPDRKKRAEDIPQP